MAISSGIYGLAGVLIGSGITAGGQWVLAARTDRLDARVAKRQVRRELEELRPALKLWALQPETSMVFSREALVTEKWNAHSDRLARQLSDADWEAVEAAFLNVDVVVFASRRRREAGESEEAQQQAVLDFKKSAEEGLRLTDEAIKRLR